MRASPHPHPHPPPSTSDRGLVVFLLGAHGEVLASTPDSERLTGMPAPRLNGRPLSDLLDPPTTWAELAECEVPLTMDLRRPDGRMTQVRLDVLPVPVGGGAHQVVMMTAESAAVREDEDEALVRALFSQSDIGLVIHDAELRVSRRNAAPRAFVPEGDPPPKADLPQPLDEVLVPEDAHPVLEQLSRVAESGEPLINFVHSARLRRAPQRERVVALSALRLPGGHGQLLGVAAVCTDITAEETSRRRAELLHTAARRVGVALDVTRDAEELARVLVPDFADMAAVDLAQALLDGDEPGQLLFGVPVRRVAVEVADGEWPQEVVPAGAAFRVEHARGLGRFERPALLDPDQGPMWVRSLGDASSGTVAGRSLWPSAPGSLLVVRLQARGLMLGAVGLWRSPGSDPYSKQDVDAAEEIGSRAALGLDNARRYARERKSVETLQRNLLPQPVFELRAAQTSGTYLPAGTAAGLGGSWYDVIPLSSARVAFVVGDVAGHGLAATATMGRLRTAVQTLADLELPPDELLTRLDDLVTRLADTEPRGPEGRAGAGGTTCLYCVYDPVNGHCEMAAAGRLPPLVARPGRPVEVVAMTSGPVLGAGAASFESVGMRLEPGSSLVMFSDELVAATGEDEGEDEGDGEEGGPPRETSEQRMDRLRQCLSLQVAHHRSPAETGQAVLDTLQPARSPANDISLLVARVQALPEDMTADWSFPADPETAGRARETVTAQLTEWGLMGIVFPTELIVSELVTNAIRWAGGPVGLRLIRDETLICEVSDPSETQPHLRSPRSTDEGGRGLFLVAQLAHRWGSRRTATGKTIWTEQPLREV
ncbi:ATP-binding SpoIIE family protein phosphatase [Streptomyces sp. SBT349]|uniref:ATP-binding SpoIIE family protein phosphatase n=1 Tax=Streptomyces sp. SBT349 TaxID=1580539 RepID=UPI00131C9252|nr:SpoIIE family protein phosphatase [Streptomyces sp. SBT349]